jgi:hypothetical protein
LSGPAEVTSTSTVDPSASHATYMSSTEFCRVFSFHGWPRRSSAHMRICVGPETTRPARGLYFGSLA